MTRFSSVSDTLAKGVQFLVGNPSFAVSPDSQSILYVQVDQTESDLVLVENFR